MCDCWYTATPCMVLKARTRCVSVSRLLYYPSETARRRDGVHEPPEPGTCGAVGLGTGSIAVPCRTGISPSSKSTLKWCPWRGIFYFYRVAAASAMSCQETDGSHWGLRTMSGSCNYRCLQLGLDSRASRVTRSAGSFCVETETDGRFCSRFESMHADRRSGGSCCQGCRPLHVDAEQQKRLGIRQADIGLPCRRSS